MHFVTLYNDDVATVVNGDLEHVAGGRIVRERNAVDSFSFDVYPNNAGYDALTEFATLVEVQDSSTGETAFEGRVLSVVPSMGADGLVRKSVTCEGSMGYLNDSLQGYVEEKTWEGDDEQSGLAEYLEWLLSVHNSKVEDYKRIYLGSCDVDTYKTTDNVTKGTNFETTWECLEGKLIDVFGGEARVRRGDDGLLYLDYCEALGAYHATGVEVAVNMAECERAPDFGQLVTRLYPRGAKLMVTETDEDGAEIETETEERLSIAEANDGCEYIDDDEAMAVYGIVEGTHEWDDVTEASNLLAKAAEWLEENNALPVSVTATAYDLSLLGMDYDAFEIHDWYPVYNPLVGLDELLEVVRQEIDLDDPSASTVEFGETSARQTSNIAALSSLKSAVETLESTSATTVTNLANTVVYVKSAIEVAEGSITETVSEQVATVSDRVDVVETNVSTLEITTDSITTEVTQLQGAYGTCSTAASTAAKVVTCSSFTSLYSGASITVRFTYKNTASSPTLNVNSTGAKAIWCGSAAISKDDFWAAGDVVTFVYGGSYWRVSDSGAYSSATSKIEQLADSITLSVGDLALGDSATITLTVGDATTEAGSLDLSAVRAAFASDTSACTISAGTITFNSNTFVVNSTYFSVTSTGVVTATSGTIGPWTLGSTYLMYSRASHTALTIGIYMTSTGVSCGSGSAYAAMQSGRIYGGVTSGEYNGYISFRSYYSTTGEYGLRLCGEGIVSILTGGVIGVGDYVDYGESATISVGQSGSVTVWHDFGWTFTDGYVSAVSWSKTKLTFKHGLMITDLS